MLRGQVFPVVCLTTSFAGCVAPAKQLSDSDRSAAQQALSLHDIKENAATLEGHRVVLFAAVGQRAAREPYIELVATADNYALAQEAGFAHVSCFFPKLNHGLIFIEKSKDLHAARAGTAYPAVISGVLERRSWNEFYSGGRTGHGIMISYENAEVLTDIRVLYARPDIDCRMPLEDR